MLRKLPIGFIVATLVALAVHLSAQEPGKESRFVNESIFPTVSGRC